MGACWNFYFTDDFMEQGIFKKSFAKSEENFVTDRFVPAYLWSVRGIDTALFYT